MELIAAGAPEDYGASKRRDLVDAFARLTGTPPSLISLTIEAASVRIRVVIAVASADAAAEVSTGLGASLSDVSSSSAILGVQVQSPPVVKAREASGSALEMPGELPIEGIATIVGGVAALVVALLLLLRCWMSRRQDRQTCVDVRTGPHKHAARAHATMTKQAV